MDVVSLLVCFVRHLNGRLSKYPFSVKCIWLKFLSTFVQSDVMQYVQWFDLVFIKGWGRSWVLENYSCLSVGFSKKDRVLFFFKFKFSN